jgi:hypothetical protein
MQRAGQGGGWDAGSQGVALGWYVWPRWGRRSALARLEDAGGDARAPRGDGHAYPTSGEAPGLGRGARRATGRHAYLSRGSARPRMRAGTPALPGGALPIPRLERRPASGAEPAGRRDAMPTSAVDQRVRGCGRGRPRSQGGRPIPELASRSLHQSTIPSFRPARAGGTPALHMALAWPTTDHRAFCISTTDHGRLTTDH